MLAWVSRLVVLAADAFGVRAYARDFVREYIRELVRERLRAALLSTVAQLGLLAATAVAVHRLGNPLGGRLLGSALVWTLIAYNLNRFWTNTVPDIAQARKHLGGPLGYFLRDLLGISIAKELVEMELFLLVLCLVLGLYVRLGVSSTFHLFAPWRELLLIRRF